MLEEKEEPHRNFMAIINADEADLLDVSLDAPEAVDLSVHYEMLKMLKEHYGATVEKAVLWGKGRPVPQNQCLYAQGGRHGGGTDRETGRCTGLVFWERHRSISERKCWKTGCRILPRSLVSHLQAALLRGLPMFYLEKEMEKAIREENYEYAELIQREIRLVGREGKQTTDLEKKKLTKRNKSMHVFYAPDMRRPWELPEERPYCLRVLRLGVGEEITLTDGKGCFYRAVISLPRRSAVW